MTGIENYHRAIEFKGPTYLPCTIGVELNWLYEKDEAKREIHELVSLFGKFDGGYIGGTSHSVMPETPLDNVIALLETFLEYQNI